MAGDSYEDLRKEEIFAVKCYITRYIPSLQRSVRQVDGAKGATLTQGGQRDTGEHAASGHQLNVSQTEGRRRVASEKEGQGPPCA